MNNFIKSLAALIFLLFVCCQQKHDHNAVRVADKQESVILVGTTGLDSMRNAPFSLWFEPNYSAAQPDEEKLEELKLLLDEVKIQVFIGTWCNDSKRELPRFIKILEQVDYQLEDVEVIAMTRDKTTPQKYEENLNITNIPTFIFYKDGQELNRIVEFPIEDLETDMVKILNEEPYKHAYDWE